MREGDWATAFRTGNLFLLHHNESLSKSERADRLYRQGAILEMQERSSDARPYFERALDAYPEHEAASRALNEPGTSRTQIEEELQTPWVEPDALVDLDDEQDVESGDTEDED